MIPILSFVGKSGSGKTTLLEKVIEGLKKNGYQVATIKHHAHPGFEIDRPGKDTWRYARAGSDVVVIASPDKVATITKLDNELALDDIIVTIKGVDIILTEGYKSAGKPAIEVLRKAVGQTLICDPNQLVAVVTDVNIDLNLPLFGLNDIDQLIKFIEAGFINCNH